MKPLVDWQKIDPSNNLVFPWFTHPFLGVLSTWDLREKVVIEYGGGRSTAWWRQKCDFVVTVEANIKYYMEIADECWKEGLSNGFVNYRPVCEGDQTLKNVYVKGYQTPSKHFNIDLHYDIVVVDGILRYECMQEGINILSDRGGTLIVDNWQQDGFLCPACEELVKPYEGHIFLQPDHTDHVGHPWQTAYFVIPAIHSHA